MNRRDIWIVLVLLMMLIICCDSATNHKPFIDDSVEIVIRVPEDTALGTSIRNITAIDQEGDPITFGLDDVGKTLFSIRNINSTVGELTLKGRLNRELVRSYDFQVTVTDGGEDRKTSKQFILTVLDVNDNKPVFVQQPYWTSIPEHTTVGTTLLTIQATDADQGTNAFVTYKFSNDSNSAQTAKFAINNLEGTITLVSKLDYETTTRYLLPVVAQDRGNPRQESKTTVVIDVTDISENPPKFERSLYLKEIEENIPVGTIVLTVVARDGDAGINNPMKYEIYSGNHNGKFAIGSSTGVITANGTIDAEKEQSYKLYVRASEVPNPISNATVSVLITVIDKNDNPPLFSQDSYSFTLREDLAKPGRIVTDQLIVRDADKNPEFRRFKYHLTGGDSDKFIINPSSGELEINSTLDYETQVNYTFTVVATETGTPEKYSDNATIHLTLINDNDNPPIFTNRPSLFSKVFTSLPTPIPKDRSFDLENSLLIMVGLLVLIIVIIVVCGMYYFTKREHELRQAGNQSHGEQGNAVAEETFQMQDTAFNSGISSNMEQQTIHSPNENRGLQNDEPQYTDLDPSTTLPSTFYDSLSPSSQSLSNAQVNNINSSSEEPSLSYEKLQHNNALPVYEKRVDLNDKLASTLEYEFVA